MPDTVPDRVPERGAAVLVRLGFASPAAAAEHLGPFWDAAGPRDAGSAAVVAALGRTADPDGAAERLAPLLHAQPSLAEALRNRTEVRGRLLSLLAASPALAGHLAQWPEDCAVLLEDVDPGGVGARLSAAVGADDSDPVTGSGGTRAQLTGAAAVVALRRAYRRELVAIAGRDLSGEQELRLTMAWLADAAAGLLRAALAVAAAQHSPPPCRLAVIGMGKTGGRELNYVSDVDVIFVAADDDPLPAVTALASTLMRICAEVAWQVDANLRPEGRSGPLVRTLASHAAYYHRWASTWEFQALLKARPIAGDCDLGRQWCEMADPLVWSAAERPDFVADVRAMRRRVVEHIPSDVGARELKLGEGGLRDVEFAVQLLQLVHGRGDETLRVGGTLPALDALRDGGYVGRVDALSLADAYSFLRAAEHRLQLIRLRRTHVLPDDAAARMTLARAMGYRPDNRGDARAVWEAEWALHAREVRRLHEKLFYRPLLEAVARVPTEGLRLSAQQAGQRLAALGFADPRGSLRHIEALTAGVSRRAALQRTLLPVLLSDFADAPDPDAGLLAYRSLSDKLGGTPWYLRLLRDEGAVASRLAFLLGTSRYVADLLGRAPEALQLLADDAELAPRPLEQLRATATEAAGRYEDSARAVAAIRAVRRTELLRIACADLLRRPEAADVVAVGEAIAATSEATIEATLRIARQDGPPVAVIAMGRLGGAEVSYGSDADVLLVTDDSDPAGAVKIAERMRSLLSAPSAADPPLILDLDLRPEGRKGPLVRSLAAYERYYERWSSTWEAQALLRARFVAGDERLGRSFERLADAVRYRDGGLSDTEVAEIRRVKGRVDAERLPRGADPATHTKLGRGGLSDIEWTVQLLQLRHGCDVPGLRTTRTVAALDAAAQEGLLTGEDAAVLATAWRFATAVRNAIMLVRNRPGDQLPSSGPLLVAVGRALGYPAGFVPGELVDDYRRATRRARRVVERIFY